MMTAILVRRAESLCGTLCQNVGVRTCLIWQAGAREIFYFSCLLESFLRAHGIAEVNVRVCVF